MRANRDAGVLRRTHRAPHDGRVARVHAAGDVRRRDNLEQLRVGANLPGAEAFSHVGIQIDCHRVSAIARIWMPLKKWPMRRFSFSSCWLLSKLTMGTSTAGTFSASTNGAIGTVPPIVLICTGGSPNAA